MKKFLLLMLLAPAALSAAADSGADASVVVRKDSAFVEKHRFLPTAKRIDRRIDRNKFAYKGEVALGITASYGTISSDDTDMMLAIKKGLERGCREFHLYGGTGGRRSDHTVANYQALLYLARRGARGWLYGNGEIYTAVCGKGEITFPARADGILSVFCLGELAAGVTIRGAHYSVENAVLTPDFPLGCSNHFIGRPITVSVERGDLLLGLHEVEE